MKLYYYSSMSFLRTLLILIVLGLSLFPNLTYAIGFKLNCEINEFKKLKNKYKSKLLDLVNIQQSHEFIGRDVKLSSANLFGELKYNGLHYGKKLEWVHYIDDLKIIYRYYANKFKIGQGRLNVEASYRKKPFQTKKLLFDYNGTCLFEKIEKSVLTENKNLKTFIKEDKESRKLAEQEKQKRIELQRKAEEEERKRKGLEQRIAELEKKNKELQQPKKQQKAKPKSGSGSGFFISKLGHIITNQHVVNKCKKITIGDHIDKQVPAKLLDTDNVNDLALLRTTNLKMASAETQSLLRKLSIEIIPLASGGLMRKSEVKGGEDVIVAGFPYGVRFGTDIKVTFGNVNSTKGIGDDSTQFQIQAPVQPGNSGGPIYDRYGNIVGVVVSQLNKFKLAKSIGSLPENVNFGIKASTVRQFLNTSGVITNYSKRTKPVSNEKMFELASKQTVMVVCHR